MIIWSGFSNFFWVIIVKRTAASMGLEGAGRGRDKEISEDKDAG
jgi:hypothetical protein